MMTLFLDIKTENFINIFSPENFWGKLNKLEIATPQNPYKQGVSGHLMCGFKNREKIIYYLSKKIKSILTYILRENRRFFSRKTFSEIDLKIESKYNIGFAESFNYFFLLKKDCFFGNSVGRYGFYFWQKNATSFCKKQFEK